MGTKTRVVGISLMMLDLFPNTLQGIPNENGPPKGRPLELVVSLDGANQLVTAVYHDSPFKLQVTSDSRPVRRSHGVSAGIVSVIYLQPRANSGTGWKYREIGREPSEARVRKNRWNSSERAYREGCAGVETSPRASFSLKNLN